MRPGELPLPKPWTTAVTIARLAGTAVFAYLLALQLPGSSRPVLAPLTALLVVQVTLYQAIRSAIRRVVSVVAGVLVAVGLAAAIGFTWWSLGITIVAALTLGYVLHLGGEILEVPISAMLILSVDTRSAATSRIIETLVGAGAGLLSSFILAAPRVQPAEEAVDDLCRQMADLLDQMAQGLVDGAALDASANGSRGRGRSPARSGAWTVLSARPRRASGSIPDACCSRAWGSACSAHWKSWSARHSRSGAWHARWPTALAWGLTTALCETRTFGPVSPWCYGS
jgi:hypothetical protein